MSNICGNVVIFVIFWLHKLNFFVPELVVTSEKWPRWWHPIKQPPPNLRQPGQLYRVLKTRPRKTRLSPPSETFRIIFWTSKTSNMYLANWQKSWLMSLSSTQILTNLKPVITSIWVNFQKVKKETLPLLEESVKKCSNLWKTKSSRWKSTTGNHLRHTTERREKHLQSAQRSSLSLGIDDAAASRITIANTQRLPRWEACAQATRQAPIPIIARFYSMPDRNSILLLAAFEEEQRKRTKSPCWARYHTQQCLTVQTDLLPTMKTCYGILANEAYKPQKESDLIATTIFVKGME